jgi:excisionase family DNA binding protein
MNPQEEILLPVAQAAKYLGVGRDKISRMIRKKELKAIRNPLDKRQYLIAKTELDNYLPGKIITNLEELENSKSPTTGHSQPNEEGPKVIYKREPVMSY